jgi:hypothetical protein
MTVKAIGFQTYGVVASIAEPFSAPVALSTGVEPAPGSVSVAHDFLSEFLEVFPMPKAHVSGVFAFHATGVFRVGPFEQRSGRFAAEADHAAGEVTDQRQEDDQHGD